MIKILFVGGNKRGISQLSGADIHVDYVQNGMIALSAAQTQEFDIRADDYEANRHYFLSQFFRQQYDDAMKSLPVPNSGVIINRIEVCDMQTALK